MKLQRVLVIGDFLTDRNWCGQVTRISPEAPCMIVKIDNVFDQPGGAGNVAANLGALGARIVTVGSPSTPIKHRLWAGNIQLIRWDENDSCGPVKDLGGAIKSGGVHIGGEDIIFNKIVIADYAKGTITDELLSQVYKMNLPTFVDTKSDPSKYAGWITAVFPNATEYKQYSAEYNLFDRCILKLGSSGMAELEFGKVKTIIPAVSKAPVSVNGAGDVVIAAYAFKWPHKDCLSFANFAASVAVERPYTSIATLKEVQDAKRRFKRENRKNKRNN